MIRIGVGVAGYSCCSRVDWCIAWQHWFRHKTATTPQQSLFGVLGEGPKEVIMKTTE
jgi:hypothetical protein